MGIMKIRLSELKQKIQSRQASGKSIRADSRERLIESIRQSVEVEGYKVSREQISIALDKCSPK